MKGLIFALALICAFGAFAQSVKYPVKNFKYLSDSDYIHEVSSSDKYVVMIFSSKECLERTIIDRDCFRFEKRMDVVVPKLSENVQVVAFNTFYENYEVAIAYQIVRTPVVILMKNNRIIKRFEPNYTRPDLNNNRLPWQDEFFRTVSSELFKIR